MRRSSPISSRRGARHAGRPDRTAPEPGQLRTIGRLWRDAVATQRDTPAYLVERADGWQPVSWAEAGAAVDEIANGLLELGVKKGDAFAISAGRPTSGSSSTSRSA